MKMVISAVRAVTTARGRAALRPSLPSKVRRSSALLVPSPASRATSMMLVWRGSRASRGQSASAGLPRASSAWQSSRKSCWNFGWLFQMMPKSSAR